MSHSSTSEGFLEVNGANLFYQTTGSGSAIVLVHAGIADASMWDEQWDALGRELQVIRYDLRGFGRSTIPPEPFAHCNDLAELLRQLSISKAIVIGASFGGNVATELALKYPEMVAGLILVNSLVAVQNFSEELRDWWTKVGAAVDAGDLDMAVELELRMWVDGRGRTPHQVDPVVRERVRSMNSALFLLSIEQEMASEQKLDPPASVRLGQLRVPTLIIAGRLDQLDALASADTLVGVIPGARKVTIDHAAHLPSMERPDEFNRIVLNFIRSL